MRENLAGGILRLVGWITRDRCLTRCAGAARSSVEAAFIARNIPAGLGRRIAFEKLSNFDASGWRVVMRGRNSAAHADAPCALYGSDIDGAVVQAARGNLKPAGSG